MHPLRNIFVCAVVLLAFSSNLAFAQLTLSIADIRFPDTNIGAPSPTIVLTVTNSSDVAYEVNPHAIPVSCPFVFGGPTPPCINSLAATEETGSYQFVTICRMLLPGQSCNIVIYFQPLVARTLGDTLVFLNTTVTPPAIIAQATLTGTGVPTPLTSGTVRVIEYYNAALDHYFSTPLEDEIRKLDNGQFSGWERTGYSYWVWPARAGIDGAKPVCRFYGRPEAGLDSHFYSASPDECQAVISRFGSSWQLETSDLFDALLPDAATGTCPSPMVPLRRLYNNRPDANHRYMVLQDSQWQTLIADGWLPEGYGNAVVMCLPAATYRLP